MIYNKQINLYSEMHDLTCIWEIFNVIFLFFFPVTEPDWFILILLLEFVFQVFLKFIAFLQVRH